MDVSVNNAPELIQSIHEANLNLHEAHTINLNGVDGDYIVREAVENLFGGNAFPIIICDLTINGNGRIITRMEDASLFRFFAVNAKIGNFEAHLTLNDLTLCNGNSGSSGGGAIANDGTLTLHNCILRENEGTLGGAIYNGDSQSLTITRSVFFRNLAAENGGAIYNSSGSQLEAKSTWFQENLSPGIGGSVYISRDVEVTFESCSVQGGITLTMSYSDFQVKRAQPPREPLPIEWLNVTAHRSARYEKTQRQISASAPLTKPSPPWWASQPINPNAEEVIKNAEENHQTQSQIIDRLIFAGEFDTLYEIGAALQARQNELSARSNRLRELFQWTVLSLASSPGLVYIDTLFKLLKYKQYHEGDGDFFAYHQIAALLASGQKPDTLLEWIEAQIDVLFQAVEQNQIDRNTWFLNGVLVYSIQELVMRGVDCAQSSAVVRFTNNQPTPDLYLEDLFRLPLRLLEIETPYHILRSTPTLDTVPITEWQKATDFNSPEIQAAQAKLPTFVETTRLEDSERICTAALIWPEHIANVFVFDQPITENDITVALLLKLDLTCLQDVLEVELAAVTPERVLSTLFDITSIGGAYTHGLGIAFGRLKSWQSLGGLAGAAEHDDPETIMNVAKQCRWFGFRAAGGWFHNDGWDIGIAALRPDGKSLALLAATDSD